MSENHFNLGADEQCILQYLKNFAGQFVNETEICRRADGRQRFAKDARWAHQALNRLMECRLIETDGQDRYRVRSQNRTRPAAATKFLDPKLRVILEDSDRGFDLSDYG